MVIAGFDAKTHHPALVIHNLENHFFRSYGAGLS
jgi:hypothetical protein